MPMQYYAIMPKPTITIYAILLYLSTWAPTPGSGSPAVTARTAVVATEDPACSDVGKAALLRGGHAVDAAVAAAFCMGVVAPPFSGLGGGGLLLLWQSSSGEAKVFDMLETAPARSSKGMFDRHKRLDQVRGKLSIAVPGQLAGLYEAWKAHGKLPWADLVRSAEDLARNGSRVSARLRRVMEYEDATLQRDPALRSIFTLNRKPLRAGDTFIQKTLASTLSEIGRTGSISFYNGRLGQSLVNDIKKSSGSILSIDDLRKYRVKIRKPLTADVMGLEVLSAPPPASGGAVLMLVLKTLQQYEIPSGLSGPLGAHRAIEALKHALAMSAHLGDPDFFVDPNRTLHSMLTYRVAKQVRSKINDSKTYPSTHYTRWKQVLDHGTTHISVVDEDRNAVSLTTSLNSIFGSGYMSPSTGILLNNHMFGFSIPAPTSPEPPPAPANFIQPGKRPISSMTPTIILKGGRLEAVIGGAGGMFIPAAVSEVILNHFVRKIDPLSSVMATRYYPQLHPNVVFYENYTWMGERYRASQDALKFLKSRNHKLVGEKGPLSSCVFVLHKNENDELVAVVDSRKGGLPAGY